MKQCVQFVQPEGAEAADSPASSATSAIALPKARPPCHLVGAGAYRI
jgi:hypothetical protein